MPLFLDLDNTILPSKGAYDYAIKHCALDWEKRGLGENFLVLYDLARKQVKSQLKHHSSNRLRLLCFKLVWEMLRAESGQNSQTLPNSIGNPQDLMTRPGFQTKDIKEIFWLEERYFFHFLHYYSVEKIKDEYHKILFPKLVSLSHEFPIFLTTNETLRTQLLKVQGFLPDQFRFTLITSEEVGFEKPSKEFFQYVIVKTNADPKDCILLGDNWEDDILGASSHGISCIHIPSMWGEGESVNELIVPEEMTGGSRRSDKPPPKNIWRASNIISGLDYAKLWLLQRQK